MTQGVEVLVESLEKGGTFSAQGLIANSPCGEMVVPAMERAADYKPPLTRYASPRNFPIEESQARQEKRACHHEGIRGRIEFFLKSV